MLLLTLGIGVVSNAETVMRDVDVEVNYDAETKPNEIEFILTLKNGTVLLGDINGDGYVNDAVL